MIMKRLSALVLLAAGFLGAVTSASAQVARDGNFYEEVRGINCSNATTCTLEFSAVPQLILFSKINCLITISGGIMYTVDSAIRDVSGSGERRREFLPVPASIVIGSLNTYSLVSATDFMVSASKLPTITAFFTNTSSGTMECKITGRLQ
jgi:hypothetical protein